MSVVDQFRKDIRMTLERAGRDTDMSDFEPLLEDFAREPTKRVYNDIFDIMEARGVGLRLRSQVDQSWRKHFLAPHAEATGLLKQVQPPKQRVEVDENPRNTVLSYLMLMQLDTDTFERLWKRAAAGKPEAVKKLINWMHNEGVPNGMIADVKAAFNEVGTAPSSPQAAQPSAIPIPMAPVRADTASVKPEETALDNKAEVEIPIYIEDVPPKRPEPAMDRAQADIPIYIEDAPPKPKPAESAKVEAQAVAPARVAAAGAIMDVDLPLRAYYEEVDLITRTFLYREPAPVDPDEGGISDYRMNDLKAFLDILRKRRVALAIGRRGFDIDGGWVRSMERSFLDELLQVVVTDLSQPLDGRWRSEIEKIEGSFPDDRTAGVLILKYGNEFIGQNVEAEARRIDESFIQSIRSHFLLHSNPNRRVVITGTSTYSGETAGHMLMPFLRRLYVEAEASIDGMALNLREMNHRQVAEIIWGVGYDRRPGYNPSAVKYVIRVLERHLPLLPAFIKYTRDDALRPLNSRDFENRIAIQGSRFSHPRPGSRNLITLTTRSDGIPDWYRSRLDKRAALYGRSALAPRVPHAIFNVRVTAGNPTVVTRPTVMV